MVTFNKKEFVAEVGELHKIIDAIKGLQGSVAERHRVATLQALAGDVTFDVTEMPTAPDIVASEGEGATEATVNLGDLATFVQSLSEWAEQMANEAVTLILKSSNDDGRLTALRAQYAKKKEFVEALRVVLATQKIDVSDVTIPQLRGAKSGSGTRTSSKNSTGQWYRIVNGVRKNIGDSQNSISSFAFYYGAALVGKKGEGSGNNGKGVATDELEKFLRDNVTDGASPLGKSWTFERDGVTYGMEVIPQDAPKTDDKKSDEEE